MIGARAMTDGLHRTGFHVSVEPQTFRVRPGRSITGEIWLNVGDIEVPEPHWLDFPVVVLGWWLEHLIDLHRGALERDLLFMDGPFLLRVNASNTYPWELRAYGREQLLVRAEVTDSELASALLMAANVALTRCGHEGWADPDVDRLRALTFAARKVAGLDMPSSERFSTSWWLDASGLPDLLWARLRVFDSGRAAVFDLDGSVHRFYRAAAAELWLAVDEYEPLAALKESGQVTQDLQPPDDEVWSKSPGVVRWTGKLTFGGLRARTLPWFPAAYDVLPDAVFACPHPRAATRPVTERAAQPREMGPRDCVQSSRFSRAG